MAEKRYYGQFCGLAAALDVIGERWTLLILRELLIGPVRFNEMSENLPGIGPNLLTDRLRLLAEHGLVRTEPVPGDGRGKRYLLTGLGTSLLPSILGLAKWGMQFLTEDDAVNGASRSAWGFLAVQAMIDPAEVPEVDESYEFRVDDEVFHIAVRSGKATAARGAATDPVMVVGTTAATFIRIGARMLSPFDALVAGALEIDGDPDAVQRCTRLIGLSAKPPLSRARGA
ncbi:winged helix-turn-helix transcriptional regulator [Amycolatopsis sp. cmx-11-51]|uniref:winged helix-turn-helix transcriptional regulator n=1 Tax=unclassified Amycolatopsis TaxID=2618356 RepID=UPI0039E28F20